MVKRKQTQYTRNRNRIMSYVRKMRRQGVIIDINIKTEAQLRKEGVKAQKLSALTRELKKLKPKQIKEFKIAEFDPDTGEIYMDYFDMNGSTNEPDFSPPEDRISTDEEFYTRIIISSWYGTLAEFEEGVGYNLLKNWADTIRSENGDEAFVKMIEDGMEKGNILTWDVVYNAEETRNYIESMMDFVPDQGVMYKDSIMDKLEFMMQMSDYFEQQENWDET